MRISLNWLKKYVNIKVSDDELVRLIGARLVEVEGVIDETHKYDNIYIVRVEKAEKIPDTHLNLCQINVGAVEVPKVEKNAEGSGGVRGAKCARRYAGGVDSAGGDSASKCK